MAKAVPAATKPHKMPTYPLHNSQHFDVREFVDERTWNILGVKAACLIDPAIVRVCDLLREKAGVPVRVNTWHYAKPGETVYKASGYRATWEKVGGELSQHRCGRAADVKIVGLTPKAVMALITANQAEFEAAGLTTVESLQFTRSWNHLDCRPKVQGWHPVKGFLVVKP